MKVAFFTVFAGGEDEEFLLGAIKHHAKMGFHLILDISTSEKPLPTLPSSVIVVREPIHNSGNWSRFNLLNALNSAQKKCEEIFKPDILVHLDCDEFFTDILIIYCHLANKSKMALVFHTVHWMPDGSCRVFGETEWHIRAWPSRSGVKFIRNPGWLLNKNFDGNPNRHPAVDIRNLDLAIIGDPVHNHLHYALGKKKENTNTAKMTISGWPTGRTLQNPPEWPKPLRLWRDHGILPSLVFNNGKSFSV